MGRSEIARRREGRWGERDSKKGRGGKVGD